MMISYVCLPIFLGSTEKTCHMVLQLESINNMQCMHPIKTEKMKQVGKLEVIICKCESGTWREHKASSNHLFMSNWIVNAWELCHGMISSLCLRRHMHVLITEQTKCGSCSPKRQTWPTLSFLVIQWSPPPFTSHLMVRTRLLFGLYCSVSSQFESFGEEDDNKEVYFTVGEVIVSVSLPNFSISSTSDELALLPVVRF